MAGAAMIKIICLLLLSVQVMAADLPGRLFYTPQQRTAKKPVIARTAHAGTTVYQGYVMRSDGVNTLWVNGQVRQTGTAVDMQQLKLPATPSLKPGQVYDGRGHKIIENYDQVVVAPEPEIPQWVAPALVDKDVP